MTRHHAYNIFLARNLPFPFDSDIRQWSHPLMIPLHCLWAKSKNRTRGHFEYDVTLVLFFWFDFVYSHLRCGCCSIVCLRFQFMQIKQFDCKMSTKKIFFKKTFRDIFGQLHTSTHKNVVLGKLPPGWFPPDNSHPESSYLGKFPSRITPTRKSTTWITPIQKIPSNIGQYSNDIQTAKTLPIIFAIKIIPTCHTPTGDEVKVAWCTQT